MHVDQILRTWANHALQNSDATLDTSSDFSLADLLMDRETVALVIQRFFELFESPDLALAFVEEVDIWTKNTFAREVSEPWRITLEK